jgi:Tfp pilus assembly protein PilW
MNLRTDNTTGRVRARRRAGYTLVEMLVAVGIGVAAMGVVATISMNTAFNYAAMGNYVVLDDQNRNALDVISREVRDASALMSFNTNSPQSLLLTNSIAGTAVTLTYTNSTLVMVTKFQTTQTNQTQTLLTGCNYWNFQLYDRAPLLTTNLISFCASTNYTTGLVDPTFTKVINMTWSCSRTILGSKLNTENVQTAQVILRNKVTQ